jgi:hypothetical protein
VGAPGTTRGELGDAHKRVYNYGCYPEYREEQQQQKKAYAKRGEESKTKEERRYLRTGRGRGERSIQGESGSACEVPSKKDMKSL